MARPRVRAERRVSMVGEKELVCGCVFVVVCVVARCEGLVVKSGECKEQKVAKSESE